jgi:hypothetical protein
MGIPTATLKVAVRLVDSLVAARLTIGREASIGPPMMTIAPVSLLRRRRAEAPARA